MAYKPHRNIRSARAMPRKFSGHCEVCGKSICSCKAYQYVDESNGAITNSAPYLCRTCYEEKYNVKIPTEIDSYKSRLLTSLSMYADRLENESEIEFVHRVMRLVESTG